LRFVIRCARFFGSRPLPLPEAGLDLHSRSVPFRSAPLRTNRGRSRASRLCPGGALRIGSADRVSSVLWPLGVPTRAIRATVEASVEAAASPCPVGPLDRPVGGGRDRALARNGEFRIRHQGASEQDHQARWKNQAPSHRAFEGGQRAVAGRSASH
jgi:hypothetical protein